MKRHLIAVISIFLILLSTLAMPVRAMATTTDSSTATDWPEGPDVFADSAIVMEASTGLILYEKNIDDQHYPASITKIMTVLLALENSSLGDVVTFSHDAVYNVDADSSRIWVAEGEQMTMQQCLYAIMLFSANDVAYGVAEHVGGSVDNFAKMMNEKAKSLGCTNTHFVNPHGLQDDNHYTSAHDMALITREAIKNETFLKIFGTHTYQIPPTNLQKETRYLANHHKLLMRNRYSYDGVIGGKTGYTSTSLYTLVTVAKRGDLELICVLMHDDTIEHEYTDTMKLFDYGFDNFSIYPIADIEDTSALSESPLFTRYNSLLSDNNSPITIDNNGYLVLPNSASFKDAKKEVSFFSEEDTPEPSDTSSDADTKIIGKISYTYQDKYVGGANIIYDSKDSPSLIKNNLGTKNPTSTPVTAASHKSKGSLRFIIIGGIVGLVVVVIGIYYLLVERPRLRRRHAYNRKRALRKLYRDDDFLDL
jgi:D-alanyl-D-alanine carboxypeptidase